MGMNTKPNRCPTVREIRSYWIEIRGRMDLDDLEGMLPLQSLPPTRSETTRFSIFTDQSGLLGFLRYLNSRGMTVLAIQGIPD
jgi:hypothetical protein